MRIVTLKCFCAISSLKNFFISVVATQAFINRNVSSGEEKRLMLFVLSLLVCKDKL